MSFGTFVIGAGAEAFASAASWTIGRVVEARKDGSLEKRTATMVASRYPRYITDHELWIFKSNGGSLTRLRKQLDKIPVYHPEPERGNRIPVENLAYYDTASADEELKVLVSGKTTEKFDEELAKLTIDEDEILDAPLERMVMREVKSLDEGYKELLRSS